MAELFSYLANQDAKDTQQHVDRQMSAGQGIVCYQPFLED